jgi:hypothetical protein
VKIFRRTLFIVLCTTILIGFLWFLFLGVPDSKDDWIFETWSVLPLGLMIWGIAFFWWEPKLARVGLAGGVLSYVVIFVLLI